MSSCWKPFPRECTLCRGVQTFGAGAHEEIVSFFDDIVADVDILLYVGGGRPIVAGK